MFLLYAIVIGVALAAILGGRLSRLGQLQLKWPWLALAGLLVQVVLFLPAVGEGLGSVAPLVYVASTLAVFGFVLRNVSVPGFAAIAVGAASNLAAIVANGGYMPASAAAIDAMGPGPSRGYSNSVELANPMLAPLTDIFALPTWLPFANVFSVGDVLIAVGVVVAIAQVSCASFSPPWRLPRPLRRGNSTE
jgi:hypothetical protein